MTAKSVGQTAATPTGNVINKAGKAGAAVATSANQVVAGQAIQKTVATAGGQAGAEKSKPTVAPVEKSKKQGGAAGGGGFFAYVRAHLLGTALVVSAVLHLSVLTINLGYQSVEVRAKPFSERMEVVLLSGADGKRPDYATLVSQLDSGGGGNVAEALRAASPLPPQAQVALTNQLSPEEQRLREIEAENQVLYSTLTAAQKVAKEQDKNQAQTAQRSTPAPTAVPQNWAEIDARYQAYQEQPLKSQITPRTVKTEYALYYKMVQEKIERVGTAYFPVDGGKKLYGELVVYIPIFENGRLYEKEGGVQIKRSSGNPKLDKAALRIVQMSAPFEKFPEEMRNAKRGKGGEVWEIITTFRFINDKFTTTLN